MDKPLILVADDSLDIRIFLEEAVLGPAGYAVQTVGDGMSALTLTKEIEPDVVITDYQMPNLTGLELVRRICSDLPHPPVIMMTSAPNEMLAVEAMRAGAIDFLSKPFEAEHMLAAVGRALSQRRRWMEIIETRTNASATAETLKRRLEEFETLALIGRTVTAMLDHNEVLTAVVDEAVRLTGAEEGSLLLIDEATGELYMRASKNFDEVFARTFRLPVEDSLAGYAIESGEPVLLDEQTPQKIKTSYLVHSLIYVPLNARGRTIGVLGVDNRKAGRTLTHEDVMIMTAMADYAAIAIENARLFNSSEAERRKLETILARVENGVIVVDPENRLLIMNQTAREAFGVNGNWNGRLANEIIKDPRVLALLRASGGVSKREEVELEDGRVFNAQRTPIDGIGQAIVMQDITHLKELDRIKSEFVTTVSHDLRSPLTAILGYIELIERSGGLNEQQGEFIRRVQLGVSQITDLVSNLLDLGRIEAGLDEAKDNTPIMVLARYALESMRSAAESKGLILESDLPEDLPMVLGAPIRLRQMIGNLLDNAIKYTPPGGFVRIEGEGEGDQLILRVRDSGPGIPTADHPYLFDKFFRASNVPEDLPGTGLGLSIVKSIVDNHDGRIWVESALGEGTTFTVVLPIAEPLE
ncbi:MAG: response regulator [Anaerolineae bacterium]|nr:MAG: response regulator [Anaerolineae bacterium]